MQTTLNRLTTIIIAVSNIFYTKIFHKKLSPEIEKFIIKLSHVGLGTILTTLIAFPVTIFAGRFLGPEEYGKYALIQSVASFLQIPMVWGFDVAMVKYASEDEVYQRQSTIVSTVYFVILLFVTIAVITYLTFSTSFSNLFSISVANFYLAIIFAFCLMLYNLSSNTLRALHKMSSLAVIQPVFACTLLFFFVILMLIDGTFKAMVFPYYAAYIMSFIVALMFTYRHIRPILDWQWVKTLSQYNVYILVGAICSMLVVNVDKLLINKYADTASVGLYQAYVMASMTVMDYFLRIFINVFFPTISKYKDKREICNKLNKIMPYAACVGFILVLFSEYVILMLYGKSYPFNLTLAILFALASVLSSTTSIYSWLLTAEGNHGARANAFANISYMLTAITIFVVFIPLYGISAAIISHIACNLVLLVLYLNLQRKVFIPA